LLVQVVCKEAKDHLVSLDHWETLEQLDLQVPLARLGSRASEESKVRLDLSVPLGHRVPLDRLAIGVTTDLQVLKVLPDQLVLQDHEDRMASQDHWDQLEQLDLLETREMLDQWAMLDLRDLLGL
jgi:hypothetical protein